MIIGFTYSRRPHLIKKIQVLDLLRSKLSQESLTRMEKLLKEGFSKEEVIRMLMETGKTETEEAEELKTKIKKFLGDEAMSLEDKLSLVKQQLNPEASALMEELLRQGYSREEVMELFLRCANNLEMINNDSLFRKKVSLIDHLMHDCPSQGAFLRRASRRLPLRGQGRVDHDRPVRGLLSSSQPPSSCSRSSSTSRS